MTQQEALNETVGVHAAPSRSALTSGSHSSAFFEQMPRAWKLRPATEITTRSVARAQSCMAVHFMECSGWVCRGLTTVRAKDGLQREGRNLVGQLEGLLIQAGVRLLTKGFTELLDRLVAKRDAIILTTLH